MVRNGRPGEEFPQSSMPAFSTELLSEDDLDAIFDYLDTFPQPTTGEGLYADYCANCHGTSGSGGVVAKPVFGEEAEDLHEQVRTGEGAQIEFRHGYMPAFGESRLTDAEVTAIRGFLGR